VHVAAHVVADVRAFLAQEPVLDLVGLELSRVPCIAVGQRVELPRDDLHMVDQLVEQYGARARVVLDVERRVDVHTFPP
jgi:hypothetical protein